MPVRRDLAALTVACSVVITGPGAASAPASGDWWKSALSAGQCIRAMGDEGTVSLESRSQRFDLSLFKDGQLTLEDRVDLGAAGGLGYTTWDIYIPHRLGHRASLCLTDSGNLVLRKNSHVEWQTGTAGKAAGGQARLTDSGRLVVMTAKRRVVWSSRTSAVLLISGDRLASGSRLVNRTFPGVTTVLRMSTDGDLVLKRNRVTVWQTDTHVRGSQLVITAAGRMVIRLPHRRTLWRSPAEGKDTILRIAQSGRIVLGSFVHEDRCWVRPAGSGGPCDSG